MTTVAPSILPHTDYVGTFKQWSLDSALTPQDISTALKRKVRQSPKSSDGKVKHRWQFTIDGEICAIWEFYGTRWSAYGSKAAFKKIGLFVG